MKKFTQRFELEQFEENVSNISCMKIDFQSISEEVEYECVNITICNRGSVLLADAKQEASAEKNIRIVAIAHAIRSIQM